MKHRNNLKKIIVLLLITVGIFACKKEQAQTAPLASSDLFNLGDTLKTQTENPKITAYKNFIWTLDSTDAVSVSKACEQFKKVFGEERNTLCDSAFVVFQLFYDSMETNLNQKHQNDTTNYEPLLFDEPKTWSKKLSAFNKNLKENGFKLSSTEGISFIEQDRSYVAQNFYPLVSQTMKEYLAELQKENKEGFALDGTIVITARQLVDRTLWYERFIAANPTFVFANNCKDYKKAYLTYLLSGYENTSLYTDKEKAEVADFYLTAYKYLLSKHSDTELAKMVAPYYEALKQKQTANAQSILKDLHIKGQIFSLK